jgi:hypothetical protein
MPKRLASSLDSTRPSRPDPLAVMGSLSYRDRAIISLLDDHEVLTTDQLARLYFTRLDVAQRRLLRLSRLSVLDRFRWRLPIGSESWHYVLGPVGSALAAARRGLDPPTTAAVRKRTLRIAQRPQLGHLVGLNGWFCDLAVESKRRGGARLAQWWSERRCGEQYGSIVRPDAAATYVEGTRRVDFFFEYDAGTETIGRVVAKLTRYGELAAAGGPAVPVLIWCVSAVRERHLQTAIAEMRGAGFPKSVAVASASSEVVTMLGVGLTGACWLAPGADERCALIDLGGTRSIDKQSSIGDREVDDGDETVAPWET